MRNRSHIIIFESVKKNIVSIILAVSGLFASIAGYLIDPQYLSMKVDSKILFFISTLSVVVILQLSLIISKLSDEINDQEYIINIKLDSYTNITNEFIVKTKHKFPVGTILFAYYIQDDICIPMGKAEITNINKDITQLKICYLKAFIDSHGDKKKGLENAERRYLSKAYITNHYNRDMDKEK